jgi:hypothetical protein
MSNLLFTLKGETSPQPAAKAKAATRTGVFLKSVLGLQWKAGPQE